MTGRGTDGRGAVVRRRTVVVLTAVVVAVALVVGIVVAVGTHSAPQRAEAATATSVLRLEVGQNSCGNGWTHPSGGTQRFEFVNTANSGTEVYLQNAETNAVYLDLEGLGINARQRATVTLGDGTYRFVCIAGENTPVHGNPVTISGAGTVPDATPGVVPVTANDLLPAIQAYGGWIEHRLPTLLARVRALNRDVRAGNLPRARRDWLAGHVLYESLGAAYGAFGDADAAINGLPATGSTALTDRDLQGFHKIEALLWTKARPSSIAPYTSKLVGAVKQLSADFPHAQIEPLDIGLRSHEILENAIQFELTGVTDAGSHTTLATLDANLTGTLAALNPIRSLLASRYPGLAKTDDWIQRSRTLIRSYDDHGQWTPLADLSRAERQRLDATLDQTVELLAPVAAITTPRLQW